MSCSTGEDPDLKGRFYPGEGPEPPDSWERIMRNGHFQGFSNTAREDMAPLKAADLKHCPNKPP